MENIFFSKFSDTEKNEKSTSKTEIYGIIKDMLMKIKVVMFKI